MHGSIRDRLEDLLTTEPSGVGNQETTEHLLSCPTCSSALESMRAQSMMLRSLRAPENAEPAPGFYARVLQQIEERTGNSIWSVFVYSPFGKRLLYGSLTLALMLGTYVITQESRDGHLGGERIVAQEFHYDAPVVGDQAQQRDAVLVNFAAHSGLTSQEGSIQ